MSEERLCEAYGEHQAYCPLHGYPIGKSVEELLAEAHAAAVAPYTAAIEEGRRRRDDLRFCGKRDRCHVKAEGAALVIDDIETHLAGSAPSPVREPEGLDVAKMRTALNRQPEETPEPIGRVRRKWWRLGWLSAMAVAREVLPKATPERPADEVDG